MTCTVNALVLFKKWTVACRGLTYGIHGTDSFLISQRAAASCKASLNQMQNSETTTPYPLNNGPSCFYLFESLLDTDISKQSVINLSPHDFCGGFALKPWFSVN